jgi:hypothetical protein
VGAGDAPMAAMLEEAAAAAASWACTADVRRAMKTRRGMKTTKAIEDKIMAGGFVK